ncbi:MAG TPA: SbcC/MukB-like Walker B domain-containing protein [Chitinophaga sp.]|uniref:ATP-binding protein n=1 Tax=Chitinophaga sp. TaxID=1869181 RepID=UPI002BA6CFC1|nr:SbcC/MukB-like Walker B domain-containing protein [Chitinophaga sp.]HVI46858.1 SbcC/MukB-like Walker B domain-containing protein [Chitinophaga sp.]
MSTLFNSDYKESGFRLQYLEIYNWGTFHNKIYRVNTGGQTSLLTGANGSGKTTLIDALLTLLVPAGKRFYNQSSGTEQRRDRGEESYFWGYYGKTFSEESLQSKTEQLRHKENNPYSVLLAYFYNAATMHQITLVQVRWYAGELKRQYIVSPHKLNINDHFGNGKFDMKGDWKKRLRMEFPKTEITDSFKEYSALFSNIFGLRSEKALSLFNQTVGIKVLGDLNTFIRSQMLEETDAESEFLKLRENYDSLLSSHRAIRKDETQLKMLEPIMNNRVSWQEVQEKNRDLQALQDVLPAYFNKQEKDILEKELQELKQELKITDTTLAAVNENLQSMQLHKEELIAQKANNSVDEQLRSIEKTIHYEQQSLDGKRSKMEEYNKLAERLQLDTNPDEQQFHKNTKAAEKLKDGQDKALEGLQEEIFHHKGSLTSERSQATQLEAEIDSFLHRKNNIPYELIRIRQQLADMLDVSEEDLPFAGELIKVKDKENHWEAAIEKVLHNFALRLLVPEDYITEINRYINENNLHTRLVYHVIEDETYTMLRMPTEKDSLLQKIDIKPGTEFKEWLQKQLIDQFDYICTDDLKAFNRARKAVTSNGLTRQASRHEKDDRPNRSQQNNYVLGWNNKNKLRLLKEEQDECNSNIELLQHSITQLETQRREISSNSAFLSAFLSLHNYSEISWQPHAEVIEKYAREKAKLLKTSDKYQVICDQLEEVTTQIKSKEQEKENILQGKGRLDDKAAEKQRYFKQIKVSNLDDASLHRVLEYLSDLAITEIAETAFQLASHRKKADESLKTALHEAVRLSAEKEAEITRQLAAFVMPSKAIHDAYPDWLGDVSDLQPHVKYLDEFASLFQNIKYQRLIEHKERFRKYMDTSMLNAITNYRAWLYGQEDVIREVMDDLNEPLRNITFNKNPDTYLQLECRHVRDVEIRNFKEKLSSAVPDTMKYHMEKDEAYGEQLFENIKILITELQQNEAWRRKVTDVRNWLDFGAKEYYIADNKAFKYYEDTASLSGGEKAQFTYTILGAAIAYQFGINESNRQHRSLRFITVDEAFSKLDPEKSHYLMEYCGQLNLQLLVVTPLDKLNIAEPYIHACHFVSNKNKRDSVVYNFTMEEYKEKKKEFETMVG